MPQHPLVKEIMEMPIPHSLKLQQFQEVIDQLVARFTEMGICPTPIQNATCVTRIEWLQELTDALLDRFSSGTPIPKVDDQENWILVLESNKLYLESIHPIFKESAGAMFYAMSLN
jgi:hypothetical protein